MQKVEVKAAFVTKDFEVSDAYTWGDGKQSAIIVPCFSDFAGSWGEINIELNFKMVRRAFPEIASRKRFLETLILLLRSVHGGLGNNYGPCTRQVFLAGLDYYRCGYDPTVEMMVELISCKKMSVIFIGYTNDFQARFSAAYNDYLAIFPGELGFSIQCQKTGRANPERCFRVGKHFRMGKDVTSCVQQLTYIIKHILYGLSIYVYIKDNFEDTTRLHRVLKELGRIPNLESDD